MKLGLLKMVFFSVHVSLIISCYLTKQVNYKKKFQKRNESIYKKEILSQKSNTYVSYQQSVPLANLRYILILL